MVNPAIIGDGPDHSLTAGARSELRIFCSELAFRFAAPERTSAIAMSFWQRGRCTSVCISVLITQEFLLVSQPSCWCAVLLARPAKCGDLPGLFARVFCSFSCLREHFGLTHLLLILVTAVS